MTQVPAKSLLPAVCVVGGGRMGAGIAQVFAGAGHRVVIVESGADAGAAALQRVRTGLSRAAELGKLASAADAIAELISTVDGISALTETALTGNFALLVEAVPEDAQLKRDVLVAAEEVVGEDCVLATNTSSLSVTDLAAALQRPERFLGLHFFNPVPASALIEVVLAPQTSNDVLVRATGWVNSLGKQSIVVRDSPGFATSRLGVLLGLEAIRMLEEGVADAAAIDTAMELGYRHPTGPLRSTDLVGLDVRLAIAEHLSATLGERFTPPALLREKVARGELGRKTGQGFYDWT